jgi:hypothetical protein
VRPEPSSLARLEKILRGLTPIAATIRSLVATFWDYLYSGSMPHVERTGEVLRELSCNIAGAFGHFAAEAERFQAAGYTVTGAEEFREATALLDRVAADLEERWPHFDYAAIDEAIARANRGEFADLSDIYDEFPELQKPD